MGAKLAQAWLAHAVAVAVAMPAAAEPRMFNIPAQTAAGGLMELSHQAEVPVLAPARIISGRRTNVVRGRMETIEAARRLTRGTGLAVTMGGGTIVIAEDKFRGRNHMMSSASKLAVAGALSISTAAHSQTPNQSGGIQDIVVTAQKKTERLQDVPVSVQVVEADTFAQRHLTDLASVAQIVPAINVSYNPRGGDLFIRGIGSGQNQSFDQSVGTFIDDIYHGRAHMSSATFLDLDRLEVLKGPQSTFFGNNAIAGALNITTKKPGNSFEANGRALYGEDGQFALEGAAGGPVSETIGIRVAATFNGGDGWIRNVNLDRDEPRTRNWAARATLTFNPTDNFDATIKYEHTRAKQRGANFLQIMNCPPPAPFVVAGSLCAAALAQGVPVGIDDNRNSKIDGDSTDFKNDEYVLAMNYHLDGATITSITGYFNYDFIVNAGVYLPAPPLTAQGPETYHQFSQEIRIASDSDGPIEYLVGAYYQADRLHFAQIFNYFFLDPVISSLPPFAPLVPYLPLSHTNDYRHHERSYALFGSLTWNITDKFKLMGGLRGSWVRKRFGLTGTIGQATQPFGGAVPLPENLQILANALGIGQATQLAGRRRDNALLPSARLQYNFNPDVMAYASYARGFKAGGFNGADTSGVLSDLDFNPEHVNAYEIGLKSKWLNNHLLLNIAAFRSDYSDLQVSVNVTDANGIKNIISNAASSRSQGIELEAVLAVTPQLRLTFNGTYLDAKNRKFPGANPTMLQQFNGQATQDLSGRPTPFAPKWSGNFTADYSMDLGNRLRLATEGSVFFSSHYYLDLTDDPLVDQEGYARIDARISIETQDDRWALDLIGKNLTNKNIIVYGQAAPFSLGSTGVLKQQPRNFAVQLRFKW